MQIELEGDELRLDFPKRSKWLPRVRNLPERRFDPETTEWVVPHTRENWQAMKALQFPLDGLPEPTRSGYRIDATDKVLLVRTPGNPENVQKCRDIPGNRLWSETDGVWKAKASRVNIEYLARTFPDADWTEAALKHRRKVDEHLEEREQARRAKEQAAQDVPDVDDFRFGTEPYDHQREAFALSRDKEAFALHMEMGTGKTKIVIDTAAWLYLKQEIDGVLVVAPNSVKDVWEEEVDFHLPEYVAREVVVYSSSMNKSEREELEALNDRQGCLRILVMNVEGMSHGRAPGIARRFLEAHDAMMVVDESTRVKNPRAKRTKRVLELGKLARYRRTMTGTPVTQGPIDIFAPFKFLDPDILGIGSYYAFRNRYCIMGGFGGKEIVGYRHLEELQDLVDPWSYRKTKDECLDLPAKIYEKIVVELDGEQRRLYDQMAQDMVAELSETEVVTAPIVLTKLLRLQQIVGGFLPVEEPETPPEISLDDVLEGLSQPERATDDAERVSDRTDTREDSAGRQVVQIEGPNPKIQGLLELADDVQGKMLIWARFRPELDLIADALRDKYGEGSVVEFHGGKTEDERTHARQAFQDEGSGVRFFVGNQQTGGMGLTLTQAQTVVYYSNSFSLEDRLQSEDRAHRAGLEHKVTYVDLIAKDTLDERVLTALREKKSVADTITGDNPREWI